MRSSLRVRSFVRRRSLGRTTTVLSASVALASSVLIVGASSAQADGVRAGQWYLSKLDVTKAWSITRGKGVKIGIVDSGVDGSVQDLRGAVVGGKDFSGDGAANGQKPVPGTSGPAHGTGVASLAAGRGHGGSSGVIGTAPQASLLSASVAITPRNQGRGIASAIRWLADNGAKVINMSFFTNGDVTAVRSAIAYAQSKDVVLVAATGDLGNGQGLLQPPASIPGVVAVTGVDSDLKRDPGATIGKGTALAAPFSTTATDPFGDKKYVGLPVAQPAVSASAYSTRTGTSLSAPIVAGIAALVRAKFPQENAATVITRLIKSATPAGGSVPNNTYGHGIVNAYKALTISVPSTDKNPLGSVALTTPTSASSTTSKSSPAPTVSSSAPLSTSVSSAAPTSAPSTSAGGTTASSDSSSGTGTGVVVLVVVVIVALIALVAWVIARNRRRPPSSYGPPPGYGPSR